MIRRQRRRCSQEADCESTRESLAGIRKDDENRKRSIEDTKAAIKSIEVRLAEGPPPEADVRRLNGDIVGDTRWSLAIVIDLAAHRLAYRQTFAIVPEN